MLFRLPASRRVAHFMEVCFNRTETFVYDFVRGCRRYEAWCLAPSVVAQPGFEFRRVMRTSVHWDGWTPGDLADRLFHRLFHRQDLPIYRALFRIRPAVIHAHFGPAGWSVLPYARSLGIPLLTSFYGYDASSLPHQPGWAERLQQLFDEGAGVLVEGPAMARRVEALGCSADKIHLMPITLSLAQYPYRPRQRGLGERLRLLFVGRFVGKKGLPVLLRALALARPQLGPFELEIIGGGDGEAEAVTLTRELGLTEQVRFLGFQPRARVVRALETSHLLAVPSVTAPDGDTEGGAPTILLEAQASGVPVLTTDHADIPFVVAAPYRPYLAAEGSAESLASALLALVADSSRWPELAEAGRAHVCLQHGRYNFDRLESVYDRVAGRSPRVSPSPHPLALPKPPERDPEDRFPNRTVRSSFAAEPSSPR
jgi:colanic acid/amylovoran biosynthesis glycosyltransferase